MTDTTMRRRLEHLVADEPPLALTLDAVTTDGRRRRRRRATAYAAGAVGTALAATAVAVPLVLSGGGDATDRLTVAPFTPAGSPPRTTSDGGLTSSQQAIADAIRSASPDGWTFDFAADRWEPGNSGVEATVDDGAGDGRLLVGISRDPGTQQLHPCTDPEFAAGVTCTERLLDDGSVLSLRGLVDSHGIEYVDVALTHPSGGGVLLEAGNFTIDWPPPQVATPEQKRSMVQQSRPHPAYTVDQLGRVAIAVDAAAFGG
jgi:hypothetical protein